MSENNIAGNCPPPSWRWESLWNSKLQYNG